MNRKIENDAGYLWVFDYDNEEFERIVENQALDINERGEFGRTPLMVAAYGEWSEGNGVGPGFLEWLMLEPDIISDIKNEMDDDRVPGTGNTALHYAVSGPQEGRLNQVKMIMDHIRAESNILNMQNDNGDTALMMVVDDGRNIDVVRYLCELPGIDLGIKNNEDKTATHNNKEICVSNINNRKEGILITGLPHNTDYSDNALKLFFDINTQPYFVSYSTADFKKY